MLPSRWTQRICKERLYSGPPVNAGYRDLEQEGSSDLSMSKYNSHANRCHAWSTYSLNPKRKGNPNVESGRGHDDEAWKTFSVGSSSVCGESALGDAIIARFRGEATGRPGRHSGAYSQ